MYIYVLSSPTFSIRFFMIEQGHSFPFLALFETPIVARSFLQYIQQQTKREKQRKQKNRALDPNSTFLCI